VLKSPRFSATFEHGNKADLARHPANAIVPLATAIERILFRPFSPVLVTELLRSCVIVSKWDGNGFRSPCPFILSQNQAKGSVGWSGNEWKPTHPKPPLVVSNERFPSVSLLNSLLEQTPRLRDWKRIGFPFGFHSFPVSTSGCDLGNERHACPVRT